MIEFARLIKSTLGVRVRTVLAQVAMFGSEGDDANAEQAENCEVLHPVGFVSRPVASSTTEAVIFRDHDEIHVLLFLDKGGALHDCAEGEAQVYSPKEPTCRIRFGADGSLKIDSKSGQDVVLNGGTAKVGRVGDVVTLKGVNFVPGTGGASLTINGHACVPSVPTDILGGGQIADGAPNVKA